jgi:hypothetical protein
MMMMVVVVVVCHSHRCEKLNSPIVINVLLSKYCPVKSYKKTHWRDVIILPYKQEHMLETILKTATTGAGSLTSSNKHHGPILWRDKFEYNQGRPPV